MFAIEPKLQMRNMKRSIGLILFVAFVMIVSIPTIAAGQEPTKPSAFYTNSHALLIGINKYSKLPQNVQLQYAVDDVAALKDILVRRYGFPRENVEVLKDSKATRQNIELALSRLSDNKRVKPNDRVLIYFSGHGQTVKLPTGTDMGFLIPSDAEIDLSDGANPSPYLATCLRMDSVWGYLESSPAKHALVIADACYSGLLTLTRGGKRHLSPAELSNLRAMQVITGGDRGQTTVENTSWGHGAFTFKLLEELKARAATPGDVFTASELHESLARSVASLTNDRQTPKIGSFRSENGEFLFVPVKGPILPAGKASILLNSLALGVKIFLDGHEVPAWSDHIEISVPPGKSNHVEVTVERPGSGAVAARFDVQEGAEIELPDPLRAAAIDWSVVDADQVIDRGLRAAPRDANLILQAANFFGGQKGDVPRAEILYNRAAELRPKSGEPFYQLALLKKDKQKDLDAGLRLLRHALELEPGHFKATEALGELLYIEMPSPKKDLTEAERLFRKAMALDPKSVGPVDNMGWLKFGWYLDKPAPDYAEAEKWFRRELEIDPTAYWAFVGLGRVARVRKDFDLAEKYFREAARLGPVVSRDGPGEGVVYMDLSSLLCDDRKDPVAAVKVLREGVLKYPWVPWVQQRLEEVLKANPQIK